MGSSEGPWRVFLSHTSEFREFPTDASYVGEVERAVAAAGHVVVDMADFPSIDATPAEVCVERVQGCDVYVGVFGTRYGSPVRDRPEVSYTELEFDTAADVGIPRLVFRLDTDASDVGIPTRVLIDLEYGVRQEAFVRRVKDAGLTSQAFDSPDRLGLLVERSLRELADTRRRIASGIMRERQPAEPPPVRATKFVNPPPMTAPSWFQDRHVETELLGGFLADPALRLVTVVGRGGIGKTAMVCRLLKGLEAGQVPDQPPERTTMGVDGIVYLSHAGRHQVDYPNLVTDLARLLSAEGAERVDAVYRDPANSVEDVMLAVLEEFPTGRVVVFLDNLESIMDPETDTFRDPALLDAVATILQAPEHAVKMIVTTRIAPDGVAQIEAGRQHRLPLDEGLDPADAEQVLRALDPDGSLGLRDADAEVLARACEQTRGFPRALEAIKAILANDRSIALAQVLDRTRGVATDEIVEVLVGQAFEGLDPAAQQVMQALAVYNAPVSVVGVDFLIEPYDPTVDTGPILTRLVNRALARADAGQFHLHPVDREYALARIPPGERGDAPPAFTLPALRTRAGDYYAQIRTPRETWRTIDDLRPQLAEFHLRCDNADYETAAAVLADIDFDCLFVWGHYRTLIDLHHRIYGHLTDPDLQQAHLSNFGNCYVQLGDYPKAITLHEEALAVARDLGDRQGEAAGLGNLGICYVRLGDYPKATALHEEALGIARDLGDRQGEAADLGNLGNCYVRLGDYPKAMALYEEALGIDRDLGDRQGEAAGLGNLGVCYQSLGDYSKAMALYEEALGIARDLGDRQGEASHLGNLGVCYQSLGDYSTAMALYEEALGIARDLGDRQGEANQLGNLANCYVSLGDYSKAMALYEEALGIDRDLGDRQGEATDLGNLGNCYQRLGDYPKAMALYEEALRIDRDLGDRQGEATGLGNLGNCYLSLGDYSKAMALYEEALGIARDLGDRQGEANQLGNLGVCYQSLGDYSKAMALNEEALRIDRDLGDRQGEANQLGNLGNCYLSLGDYSKAMALYEEGLGIARDLGDRQGEANQLGNLGVCYQSLGDYSKAMALNEEALGIARDLGDRYLEASGLAHLAEVRWAVGGRADAVSLFEDAIRIADAIGEVEPRVEARTGLAGALLEGNDPAAALTVTEAAGQFDYPQQRARVRLIEGLALVALGRPSDAGDAFTSAVAAANDVLALAAENVDAWDVLGLAWCGVAVCADPTGVTRAVESFGRARAITAAAGTVADVVRLFDLLASSDDDGVLAGVRDAISGPR